MEKLNLKSNRLKKEFLVDVYEKEGSLVIRHTSLENIFWTLPDKDRPSIRYETIDMRLLPGTPPIFLRKCILEKDGTIFERVGEMTCLEWDRSNEIVKRNPIQTCDNRAFDKAFIRFMQFDISSLQVYAVYGSEEIPEGEPRESKPLSKDAAYESLNSKNISVVPNAPQEAEEEPLPEELMELTQAPQVQPAQRPVNQASQAQPAQQPMNQAPQAQPAQRPGNQIPQAQPMQQPMNQAP